MSDLNLTITIPEGKVAEYAADYLRVHPNTEVNKKSKLIYTNAQWIREHIRQYIVKQIKRGKVLEYREAETSPIVDDIS